jgi:hypothetical protein
MIEATWLLIGVIVGFFLSWINLRIGLRVSYRMTGGKDDILAVEKKPKDSGEDDEFDQDMIYGPEEFDR